MKSHTTNPPRRRFGRALLASAVTTLAVTALPAVADAASVAFIDSSNGGAVSYVSHPNEVNNVRVSFTAAGIVVDDQVPVRTLSSECRITSADDAICPGTANRIFVETRDRNDTVTYTAPHEGFVCGGSGADTFIGGLRQAGFGREIEPVFYEGHGEIDDLAVDTVSYRLANSRVDVKLDEVGSVTTLDDGRPGDLEGIFHDKVDASSLKPRRSGFRYVIRSHGQVGTAVDGHLRGPIRPLVLELRAQMDRLQEKASARGPGPPSPARGRGPCRWRRRPP
jgi:hypothetical protein